MENNKLSRREQREEVVKRLYQMDMTSDFSDTESNYKYITDMLEGVSENMDFIDDAIADNLIKWKLNRLTYIDRAIMRCAVYEMYFTPLASEIVINEALNITRKYSDEGDNKTVKFTNKVLDNIKVYLKK
jgi:N utilization substance protein B